MMQTQKTFLKQSHLILGILFTTGLLFMSTFAGQPIGQTGDRPPRYSSLWNDCLSQEASWYQTSEALQIADNMLLYQRSTGGWPKNIDMTLPLNKDEKQQILKYKDTNDATIDNTATTKQLKFLARVYSATKRPDLLDSFNHGLDYLFAAQYPNGGWPQFYPKPQGYQCYITFNDNAMINVLDLMQNIVVEKNRMISSTPTEKKKQNRPCQKASIAF